MKTSSTSHPTPTVRQLFWPPRSDAGQRLLATPGLELGYLARGALLRACEEIARATPTRRILLPAFHCPSGITPALMAGLTPVFYRIRRDLSIDHQDLMAKADDDTCAVLVIHFFGIEADLTPLAPLRARGVRLIEDWSHSFLQGDLPALAGRADSDYRVYSFWKLMPSGVGGGLLRNPARRAEALPAPTPAPLKRRLIDFKQSLEEALEHGPPGLARSTFRGLERVRLALKPGRQAPAASAALPAATIPGEARYPVDRRLVQSAMPPLARRILEAHEPGDVARRRRDNFRRYAQSLHAGGRLTLLYDELPAQACPWVFPVLLEGRDAIDHTWRAQGVGLHTFGIYLHSRLFEGTDMATVDDARYLAAHLLCLAIHQDISGPQIQRAVGIIETTLGRA